MVTSLMSVALRPFYVNEPTALLGLPKRTCKSQITKINIRTRHEHRLFYVHPCVGQSLSKISDFALPSIKTARPCNREPTKEISKIVNFSN